jgi:Uma2 family endonuclease
MLEWIENGVELGWLIDPKKESVTIYRPGGEPEVRAGIVSIDGEGPIKGFTLDLQPVWTL